jgi:GT2 family glycosyltransferase
MSPNYSSTNRVAVVVLNWNGLSDTLSCLTSLKEMKTALSYEVFVVDNASTEPGTAVKLNEYSHATPGVKVAYNTSNLGFSGGVNTGIRLALEQDYSHIALLNNDAVVTDNWLDELVAAFDNDKKIGIVTGSLLHRDGATIDSTGEQYSLWGLPFPRLRGSPTDELPESGFTFGATGGASLYSSELFKDIGLFDESYFAYYEDVDISFRAQLAGWGVYFESRAVAHHTRGASSSKIPGFTVRQAIRNLPLLYIRNVPGGLLIPVGLRFWLAYVLITAKAILSPNVKPAIIGLLQGMWLFWTHGIPSRFRIQRKNKVSSRHIRKLLWNDLPPDQTGLRKLLRRPVQ